MKLLRLWHNLLARLCWLEIDALKRQRRHSAQRIIEIEAELSQEKRYLAGIDGAIRLTERDATRAAMRAMI